MNESYELFTSLDDMLSPDVLGRLLGRDVANVEVQPLQDNEGYSGSNLFSVKADPDVSLVLKQIRPIKDWHMITTKDVHCRSVTLYQYGLLDRPLPQVQHAILGCSKEPDKWGILMHDVSAGLHPLGKPLTAAQIELSLTTLATIHAQFWNAKELASPALGLCAPADLIGSQLPTTVAKHPDHEGPIPHMIETGWSVLKEDMDPTVFKMLEQLVNDNTALIDAMAQLPSTLVHGDYRTRNISYMPHSDIVVFDWQSAARSLMTIDLCWFVDKTDFYWSDYLIEDAVQYYLKELTHKLGDQLDLSSWPAMIDLGFLAHSLRMATITAWYSKHAPEDWKRKQMSANVSIYNDWIRAGVAKL